MPGIAPSALLLLPLSKANASKTVLTSNSPVDYTGDSDVYGLTGTNALKTDAYAPLPATDEWRAENHRPSMSKTFTLAADISISDLHSIHIDWQLP